MAKAPTRLAPGEEGYDDEHVVDDAVSAVFGAKALEDLSDEECALAAILQDVSGIDISEFSWPNEEAEDGSGCWRLYPFQWSWWACADQKQIDRGARSTGKSQSIKARASAFPFAHPGGQMVITAPEKIHVKMITDQIENLYDQVRLLREMRIHGRFGKQSWPFTLKFANGAILTTRIPQRDGKGIKGCVAAGTPVLTTRGTIPVEEVVAGDEVLTHNDRWRPVAMVESFEDNCWEAVSATRRLTVSGAHNFMVRPNLAELDGESPPELGDQRWCNVEDLVDDWAYWAVPQEDGTVEWEEVAAVTFVGTRTVYNPVVEEDHSLVAAGVVCHNTHPIWLEMDECFPAGTLVLTDDGLVPIENVAVGDRVYTHRNRWRRVTNTFERGERDAVSVRGQGHPGLVCTPQHKFWAQRVTKWKDTKKRKGMKELAPADWLQASHLPGAVWSSPERLDDAPPAPTEVPRCATGPNSEPIPLTPELLWALGLWIAEGSVSKGNSYNEINRVTWSIHVDEVDEVMRRLRAAGLKPRNNAVQSSDKCRNIVVGHASLARFLVEHCGKGALNKQIPTWVFSLDVHHRRAVLEGLVYGDGHPDSDIRYAPGRWKLTTASKALAVSARLLASSFGYVTSMFHTPVCERTIRGRAVHSSGWYQMVANTRGQGFSEDGKRWSRVKAVSPAGRQTMFDLEVEEDHSFVADGIVVSNSQNYGERGWEEIQPTLQKNLPGAQWRSHGVTLGIPDDFYRATQDPMWTVHTPTQLHMPTWNEDVAAEEIEKYKGKETGGYKRNILGLHGDAQNAIFFIPSLMQCVDTVEGSTYNVEEYHVREVRWEKVQYRVDKQKLAFEDSGQVAIELLELPAAHTQKYKKFWAGMDVGITRDPSEVMVFAEYVPTKAERTADQNNGLAVPPEGMTRLKLLARYRLLHVPVPFQAEILAAIASHYRPTAVSLDATGNGQGVLQGLQLAAHKSRIIKVIAEDSEDGVAKPPSLEAEQALVVIKGYNFGGKVYVDIDEQLAAELPPTATIDEILKHAGKQRYVKDKATDVMRDLVDLKRLLLPNDENLILQLTGQTFTYDPSPVDSSGRRRQSFSEGQFHAFDGCRMAALGMALAPLEMWMKTPAKKKKPILDQFVQP